MGAIIGWRCSKCGEPLAFWEDRVPMNDRELKERNKRIVEKGCPKCGEKHVVLDLNWWD